MLGSWAGAMGHTQFIPTTYLGYAVDFTGDGRRNIWSDDPSDALASAANYLLRSGWRSGLDWGFEVSGPPSPATAKNSKSAKRASFADWSSRGLRKSDGSALPASGAAKLIQPAGIGVGPRFLITRNFDTLLRYNNSDKYVLAVGILANRLAGGGPLRAQFPADAFGLTLKDRISLQKSLASRGFDIGSVDGVIGPKTQTAISSVQSQLGMTVTGQPSRQLLGRL